MRLPVIVERNAWTLAHERFNAGWIESEGLGLVVSNFSKVADAVRELLSPERYRAIRANVAATRNTAVYEIPAMLEKIMETARGVAKGLSLTMRQAHVHSFAQDRRASLL